MHIQQDLDPRFSEAATVEFWRLRRALDLGVTLWLAEQVAASRDVDLHRLEDMIVAGCKPNLAARVLL